MSPIWVHCYMLMLCLEIYCPIRWFGDTTQKLSNYCTSTCTSEPEAEPVTTSYMFSGSISKQSSIYTHIYIYIKKKHTHKHGWHSSFQHCSLTMMPPGGRLHVVGTNKLHTPWKFNMNSSPLKMYRAPKGSRIVFQASFSFRGRAVKLREGKVSWIHDSFYNLM